MNIFFLDHDLQKSAQAHVDRHVVKQTLEAAQIITNCYPFPTQYRKTHPMHPMCVWARASKVNFEYALLYGKILAAEYTYRYGKRHKTEDVLDWFQANPPKLPDIGMTEPPRCFGPLKGVIKETNNIVTDYREYYRLGKQHLFNWKNRQRPAWL